MQNEIQANPYITLYGDLLNLQMDLHGNFYTLISNVNCFSFDDNLSR